MGVITIQMNSAKFIGSLQMVEEEKSHLHEEDRKKPFKMP